MQKRCLSYSEYNQVIPDPGCRCKQKAFIYYMFKIDSPLSIQTLPKEATFEPAINSKLIDNLSRVENNAADNIKISTNVVPTYDRIDVAFVPKDKIRNLTNQYMARRIPIGDQQTPVSIYQGITYRGDSRNQEHEMLHIFEQGFKQQNIPLDFDVMNGFKYGGITDNQGISTASDYDTALKYSKNVYIIDLSEHPFAIDINHTAVAYNLFEDFNYKVDGMMNEINVANRIGREQVFGLYNNETQMLSLNPNYKGVISHHGLLE